MRLRNDVSITKDSARKASPWLVRWWGKYDPYTEKQARYSRSFKTKKKAERFSSSLKTDIEDSISGRGRDWDYSQPPAQIPAGAL